MVDYQVIAFRNFKIDPILVLGLFPEVEKGICYFHESVLIHNFLCNIGYVFQKPYII